MQVYRGIPYNHRALDPSGKLPVSKTGRTYSFHARDLKNWAEKNHISLNLEPRPAQGPETEVKVSLSTALETGGVYHDIDTGPDVPSVINACVERIEAVPDEFKNGSCPPACSREKKRSPQGSAAALPFPTQERPLNILNSLWSQPASLKPPWIIMHWTNSLSLSCFLSCFQN